MRHCRCYYYKTENSDFKIDDIGIREARWFGRSKIPVFHALAINYLLNMYDNAKSDGTI